MSNSRPRASTYIRTHRSIIPTLSFTHVRRRCTIQRTHLVCPTAERHCVELHGRDPVHTLCALFTVPTQARARRLLSLAQPRTDVDDRCETHTRRYGSCCESVVVDAACGWGTSRCHEGSSRPALLYARPLSSSALDPRVAERQDRRAALLYSMYNLTIGHKGRRGCIKLIRPCGSLAVLQRTEANALFPL